MFVADPLIITKNYKQIPSSGEWTNCNTTIQWNITQKLKKKNKTLLLDGYTSMLRSVKEARLKRLYAPFMTFGKRQVYRKRKYQRLTG